MLVNKHPDYTEILIEPKSNGYALIDKAKQKYPYVMEVDPPTESKRSRAITASGYIQRGHLFIPSNNKGDEFLSQILNFMGTSAREKDDLVDTMVMAFLYYNQLFENAVNLSEVNTIKMDRKHTDFGETKMFNNPVRLSIQDKAKSIMLKYQNGNSSIRHLR
jgi:hypothetical protein